MCDILKSGGPLSPKREIDVAVWLVAYWIEVGIVYKRETGGMTSTKMIYQQQKSVSILRIIWKPNMMTANVGRTPLERG